METGRLLSLSTFFLIFSLKLCILSRYYCQAIQEVSRNKPNEIRHVFLPFLNEISLKRRENLPSRVQSDHAVISKANYYCPLQNVFVWFNGLLFVEVDTCSWQKNHGFCRFWTKSRLTEEKICHLEYKAIMLWSAKQIITVLCKRYLLGLMAYCLWNLTPGVMIDLTLLPSTLYSWREKSILIDIVNLV